ncbi:DNA methyltransferase [Alkalinema sp. FACHB-956]|uniref:DNA methyltransferase n=1 Tax=Alkalinema sp. FACHB-956 TaxID=2692768 RepID=UPI0016873887|nr:DNA methyltransferase [Alkalinema sp. FACHB-956]MBD2325298.1 class I SAM-dependent DNA methyltransferase [Alkalinema sp. FACHB-956]
MPSSTPESLQKFVSSCAGLKDEKSDAQTFLNRFFQAFGYGDAAAAGAVMEKRIKKGSKTGKTGFADLVWTPQNLPGVLIEMKKKGEDLSKHYAQALQYWTFQVPKPKYVVLCNFDEFWIYDFNIQVDTPVDRVSLAQFVDRAPSAFAFMESSVRKPVFQNNQQEITEKAGKRMGELCQMLKARGARDGFDDLAAQRFVLQCVLAMFAEDRGLLPRDLFVSCVQECLAGTSSYDVLGGLFLAMNTPGRTPAGRYKDVEYFNGGLFERVHPIELTENELRILDVAAREDWSRVRPAIFGNIFEGTANAVERHKHGMHYTSEVDIMKIVRPTISRYWEERIAAAGTIGELNALQLELQNYRVLDPACGSGNFLYLAYLELKRIERLLLDRIAERRRGSSEQMAMGFVTPLQFFGIDLNPFAVELARVTLMIARKIAIDNFGIVDQPALPLDSLDDNIVCADALFTEWPKADAIIGNPPFLGGYRMRQELGDAYTEKVASNFFDVRDKVDFCIYWFRLAHQHLSNHGRAGLVGTNTVSQGTSRTASLEYIVQNQGYIHDAISSQPWSGDAKVHVSLVNWTKIKPHKYYLNNNEVSQINSSLTNSVDVSVAERLTANLGICFEGVKPTGKGFLLNHKEAQTWIQSDASNADVMKPFSDATSLTDKPSGSPDRWIIDFYGLTLEDASNYRIPFERVKTLVKPEREKNRDQKTREFWWLSPRPRPEMRQALSKINIYLIVPRHSKWFMFLPASSDWLPSDSTKVVASEDFYILGILTSNVHRTWVKAQSSTLKGDTRYTHNTCFETFPFPQTPTQKQIDAIRTTALELHEYRSQQMEKKGWGITKLYNEYFHEPASQLAKLHKTLDDHTLKAYGFKPTDDLLEKLLALNLELAEKEKQGQSVIGPWAPDNPPKL